MEEEDAMSPPFWLQDHRSCRLRRSYSLFFSSGALFIFLLATALVFIFIVVPTLHSFTSHILKPHSVKKSWDSLNLVLVLFAIVCGLLSRNNNNETPRSHEDQSFSNERQEYSKVNPETPRSWYEYSDGTAYKSVNRLRSFNSYPDLRQESSWFAADERWRFYDDTHVGGYRESDIDEHRQFRRRQPRLEVEEEEMGIKNIAVDTFVVRTREVPSAPESLPPASPSPLQSSTPTAPRSKEVRTNAKRTYRAIGQAETIREPRTNYFRTESLQQRPSTAPPWAPPPPPPLSTERKIGQNKKKGGSATKEFLTSLSGRKKKQRQRSVENFEILLNSDPPPLVSHPPPPPPPPPPSVFHNLFSSKKIKHKKPLSPSPPPQHISSMRVSKTKPLNRSAAMPTDKHHSSNKKENVYPLEENVITGNESPLIPIPPRRLHHRRSRCRHGSSGCRVTS